jgi:hypothetical protein
MSPPAPLACAAVHVLATQTFRRAENRDRRNRCDRIRGALYNAEHLLTVKQRRLQPEVKNGEPVKYSKIIETTLGPPSADECKGLRPRRPPQALL